MRKSCSCHRDTSCRWCNFEISVGWSRERYRPSCDMFGAVHLPYCSHCSARLNFSPADAARLSIGCDFVRRAAAFLGTRQGGRSLLTLAVQPTPPCNFCASGGRPQTSHPRRVIAIENVLKPRAAQRMEPDSAAVELALLPLKSAHRYSEARKDAPERDKVRDMRPPSSQGTQKLPHQAKPTRRRCRFCH